MRLNQIEELIPEHIIHTREICGFMSRQMAEFFSKRTGKAFTLENMVKLTR